ncbi:MAG: DUF11 domain-containing protein, partial [Candidatus Latescibacterota bacterium]
PSGSWVGPNDLITYTVVVANNGSTNITGVRITDTLPAGVSYVAGLPGSYTWGQTGSQVTCSVGTLAPGEAADFIVLEAGTSIEGPIARERLVCTVASGETVYER